MTGIYSDSEREWLNRRARKISAETGQPLLIALSSAMGDLVRLRERPKAEVFEFSRPRKFERG